jgi:Putative zinc-finger
MTHRQAVETLASERYLLDEMTELERHAFEEHFFDCRDCADDVRAGETMRLRTKSALAARAEAPQSTRTVIPFSDRARKWRPAVVVPWTCAATIAMLFGYQSLLVLPPLRQETAARAFAPVVLRPASRGADQIVALAHDQPFAALSVDVNSSTTSGALNYEVTNEAGAEVVRGTAPQPAAGTPLLVMIPARQLTAGGHYRIVLSDQNGSVGEYRFAVAAPGK